MYNQTKYYNYNTLLEENSKYKSPKIKISRLITEGKILKIKRDLYVKGKESEINQKILANLIYGPSYISFEYALEYYGLIPERVNVITSSTFNKNKNKVFKTPAGIFEYRYINKKIYPYGITRAEESGEFFIIATKAKALCDTLSKISPVKFLKNLAYLLFEDLRISEDDIYSLDSDELKLYSDIYKQNNVKLLYKLIKSKRYAKRS